MKKNEIYSIRKVILQYAFCVILYCFHYVGKIETLLTAHDSTQSRLCESMVNSHTEKIWNKPVSLMFLLIYYTSGKAFSSLSLVY